MWNFKRLSDGLIKSEQQLDILAGWSRCFQVRNTHLSACSLAGLQLHLLLSV